VLAIYLVRCRDFDSRWGSLRPGVRAEAVRSSLGEPDDDRKLVDILGAPKTKVVWEYARGPFVYEVRFESEGHHQPTVLFDTLRRYKEGREWISFRSR